MSIRIIIAGGGTGGHIFPAVAVANALKAQQPDVDILFIGAKGKMEMEKVPLAGYRIVGLDIAGFERKKIWKNIGLPIKMLKSFIKVRTVFRDFKPAAAFGVGGYSSYPVLKYAQWVGVPTYLHEANAFGGKSNQLLAKKAIRVFVGTPGMEQFFPASKIMFTGNPVRQTILAKAADKATALAHFGIKADGPVLLVVGGSLGARSINEAVKNGIDAWLGKGYGVIWQTGKLFGNEAKNATADNKAAFVSEFINEMHLAYAAADIVISRAGAMSVTELCITGKAVIFVPFPFAAEDHQTANAMALVQRQAALLVPDAEAAEKLMPEALRLAEDYAQRESLMGNIIKLAKTDADVVIAQQILNDLIKQ